MSSDLLMIVRVFRLLGFALAAIVTARGASDADALFAANTNAVSDRAAGIGKRIKPGGTLVLAEIAGPAVLRHFWLTNVRAVEPALASGRVTLRFYWDGATEPNLVVPLNEFFGRRFTDSPALVFPMALGKTAYYVMPFRRAARVELRNDSDVELSGIYWQIDFDQGALPADVDYFGARSSAAAPPTLGADRAGDHVEGHAVLSAESNVTIAQLTGPAVIRRVRVAYDRANGLDEVLVNRGVIVRMFWDDETQPSVEVPLGDFFATGFGARRDFTAEAWEQAGTRGEIRFPMPFKRSARIELANVSGSELGRFSWRVDYERKQPEFAAADLEYFHACFRTSRPVPLNSTHVAMKTVGRGKFVGLVWSCHWLNAEQKPEGTQNFWVDGRRIQSTGSEDYFGRAWGFGSEPECHPYKGISVGPEPSASTAVPAEWRRVTAYRAHVLDPIRFEKSLTLDFTCYGYNRGHRTDDYATACFWYQAEPHTEFLPLPPIEDLLPLDHPGSLGFGQYLVSQAEARKDYAAALSLVNALILAWPRSSRLGDLRFKRGCLLEDLGRRQEAASEFRELRRMAPDAELAQDIDDKLWLLEQPGRLLLKMAAPSRADIRIDGKPVVVPANAFARIPVWGQREIYRFTYPPMKVAWDSPSSAIMRLPTIRVHARPGRHVVVVKASATPDEPIFTPRVGYFFAALDVAGPDIVTDASWLVAEPDAHGWEPVRGDGWRSATVHPAASFGDGAWTWLWPRGFRNFPGAMARIWGPAVFPEDKAFRPTLVFRKEFVVPR